MMATDWLSMSVGCYLIASLVSLIGNGKHESSLFGATGGLTAFAGLLGVIAAISSLLAAQATLIELPSMFYFSDLVIRLDGLSSFMVLVISLIAFASGLYSIDYLKEYEGKGAWGITFFLNLFVASMIAVVTIDNSFYFIVFFEMMSFASYFLVLVEQNSKSTRAGLQYFIIAHGGSVLIMVAFFLLYQETGSLNFADYTNLDISAGKASAIFLLAFLGFGAKAGMITLHAWLPLAHPAAPSHASALMSGVMVKIGVFGIIKVGLVFLGAAEAWWGYVVLIFGALSSVLGVMYALAEHDIKRLLAYHTVENVGIILLGVGVAMIATANGYPVIATIGLLGALYHLLNHAVFKSLLFLGAGSIINRIHTKDMDSMGGLGKVMPYTAFAFLIGTLAISALPPLNGFVSEWFIYQSLFSMSKEPNFAMLIAGPFAIVMLAITGALACMCFVKVFGLCFGGAPRSQAAHDAREVPVTMLSGTWLLAFACIGLGVGAPWIAPYISTVASDVLSVAPVQVAQGSTLFPGDTSQALLSTPTIAVVLGLLVVAAVFAVRPFGRRRLERRVKGDPWACGYKFERRMTVSAGGFTQPLRSMFAPIYRARIMLDPSHWMSSSLQATTGFAKKLEPSFEVYLVEPCRKLVGMLSVSMSRLQGGDFRVYCLYTIVTLFLLLIIPLEVGVQ